MSKVFEHNFTAYSTHIKKVEKLTEVDGKTFGVNIEVNKNKLGEITFARKTFFIAPATFQKLHNEKISNGYIEVKERDYDVAVKELTEFELKFYCQVSK